MRAREINMLIMFTKKTAAVTRVTLCLVIGLLFAPVAARAQAEDVVYYHTDAIGSVRAITDATGAVIGRYDYLPFGELWPSVPPAPAEVRQFGGKERDDETGLDYFGARYHSSNIGRFTTVDPAMNIEVAMLDPQRWNRYAYAKNNPFVFIDPDGRDAILARSLQVGQFMRIAGEMRDKVAEVLGANSAGPQHPHAVFAQNVVDFLLGSVLPRNSQEMAALDNAAIMGVAGSPFGSIARLKPVNLPAWRTVAIDMQEVVTGHTSTGQRALQSGIKSIFPDSMGQQQIETAIRHAYRYGKKIGSQGDRVQIQGPWNGGTIEMWLNRVTKTIETAYPLR